MRLCGDFKKFRQTFGEYRRLFGLTGYKCYYKYEPFEDGYADITVDQDNMVATVRLNSKGGGLRDAGMSAKHESLHLLMSRLERLAIDRFTRANEIYEEIESIVFKLEELIPDIKS